MVRLVRMIGDWIEEQTGMVSTIHEFMDEPLPAKVGWPHVLGSAVAVAFLIQLVTGAFMMVYYVPTPDHAYETVEYIEQLAFGSLVRGLHHFGATAMVVLVGLHLLQVFIWGAYKRPRQMIWVIGLALLGLTFAFSFTGYLLPWDQKAYWATVVGTNIAGCIPYVGHFLRSALRGGEAVGASTLTRFFTIHVFALPVFLELLIVFHIYQVRHHGLTPPWAVGEPENVPKPQRFFPHQIFKDCVVALALLLVLLYFALSHGAPLEPMANPSDTTYLPRPEWYFLPVYEVLKYLPGKYGEFVGAIVIPTLGFLGLLLLPYVDRNPHRLPRRRPLAMGLLVLAFTIITVFGVQGMKSTPAKTQLSDVGRLGEKLFVDLRCDSCHPINAVGGNVAPDLAHAAKRDAKTLEKLLRQPTAFNERTIMPATELPPGKMATLVKFLQELDEHYEYTRVPQVGPKKPYSHFEENWFLAHKFEMRKDPTYCESCHKPAFCQTCHRRRRPDSHLHKWLRYHYGVATENPAYCQACHESSFCDACHAEMTHTTDWTVRHGAVSNEKRELCKECHRDETCKTCHTGARPHSHGKGWLESHGTAGIKGCDTCHGRSFCQNCHMGAKPKSHTPDWPRIHGGPAKSGKQECSECHSTSFCNSCHGTSMPHPRSFKLTKHMQVAKRNPGACLRCHQQDFCTQCHGLELPHPKGWRAKTHGASAKEAPQVCGRCHAPATCGKCHDQDSPPASHDADDWNKAHGKQGEGHEPFCALCHGKNSCEACHGLPMPHPTGWRTKPHSQVVTKSPELCGRCHKPTHCAKCHDADNPPESHFDDKYTKSHAAQSKGQEALCAACHGKTGCDDCHKKNGVEVSKAKG